jgi:hypothetical protein
MLHVKQDDTLPRAGFSQILPYLVSELDEFFALMRTDFESMHDQEVA